MAKKEYTTVEAAGHEIRISSPSKVYFPKPKHTKLDLVEYYLAVEEAAVNQLRERPGTMKRFVDGAAGEFFFQKRVPKNAPRLARRPRPSPSPAAAPRPSWSSTTPPTWPGRSTSA